jgi:hypothetical protein
MHILVFVGDRNALATKERVAIGRLEDGGHRVEVRRAASFADQPHQVTPAPDLVVAEHSFVCAAFARRGLPVVGFEPDRLPVPAGEEPPALRHTYSRNGRWKIYLGEELIEQGAGRAAFAEAIDRCAP